MKSLITVVTLLCLLVSGPAIGEELTPQKQAAIKELMMVTGATKIGAMFSNAFAGQMIQALKQSRPDVDPRIFNIIKEETEQFMTEEMVEKESFFPFVYPIYKKYLSLEELKGLIAFYKTPLGKKAVSVLPQLTQESMMAGQQWAQTIIPAFQQRLTQRLKQEGIELQ